MFCRVSLTLPLTILSICTRGLYAKTLISPYKTFHHKINFNFQSFLTISAWTEKLNSISNKRKSHKSSSLRRPKPDCWQPRILKWFIHRRSTGSHIFIYFPRSPKYKLRIHPYFPELSQIICSAFERMNFRWKCMPHTITDICIIL